MSRSASSGRASRNGGSSRGATLLSLIVGGLGAYSLSRFDFFGIGAFSKMALICYMLPEVLIVLPLYIYVVKLGLADTSLTRPSRCR